MWKKIGLTFAFLFATLTTTGCSNYKELNEVSIIVGMGIDYLPSKHLYQVVFESINPSENQAQGSGTGSGATPVTSFATTGRTLSEAEMNTAKLISRENIYSHIELIILGEHLVKKESLNFIFDIFERDASIRVNIPVLVARHSDVKTLMDILPSNDKIPIRTIVGKMKNSSSLLGEYGEPKIYEVIEKLSSPGSEPALDGISVVGDKKKGTTMENLADMEKADVKLNGIAIFRKGKFVRWLDGKEAKSIQVIANKIKFTSLQIHCDGKRFNNIEVNRLKSHTKVDVINGQAVITVNTNAYGYASELLCNKDISKVEVLKEYEQKSAQELKKEIEAGIKAAQKSKSDVFGFGDILHYNHPKKWHNYEDNWNDLFSEAKVKVQVNMVIEDTGMRIKPYPY